MATTLRDASTVLPLRNGPDGLEVFMVKRSSDLGFLGGHHVFPGGAVDGHDCALIFERLLDGFDGPAHAARFGMQDQARARGHIVAAIRELFEEAGILLARRGGPEAGMADDTGGHRYRQARLRVAGGQLAFAEFVENQGLRLAADSLCYFAHWITPKSGEKRFDTRFFIASMPDGQSAEHDHRESTEGEWVRPGQALDRYARREIELVPPTICTLDRLALHHGVDEALEAARSLEVVDVVPKIALIDEGIAILYPGDEDYETGVARPVENGRMLNRLVLRNGLWVRP